MIHGHVKEATKELDTQPFLTPSLLLRPLWVIAFPATEAAGQFDENKSRTRGKKEKKTHRLHVHQNRPMIGLDLYEQEAHLGAWQDVLWKRPSPIVKV